MHLWCLSYVGSIWHVRSKSIGPRLPERHAHKASCKWNRIDWRGLCASDYCKYDGEDDANAKLERDENNEKFERWWNYEMLEWFWESTMTDKLCMGVWQAWNRVTFSLSENAPNSYVTMAHHSILSTVFWACGKLGIKLPYVFLLLESVYHRWFKVDFLRWLERLDSMSESQNGGLTCAMIGWRVGGLWLGGLASMRPASIVDSCKMQLWCYPFVTTKVKLWPAFYEAPTFFNWDVSLPDSSMLQCVRAKHWDLESHNNCRCSIIH